MFVDVYMSASETVPRADVSDELEDRLPAGCEVVGAGSGMGVSNVDIEIPDRSMLPAIDGILQSLGLRGDTVLALSDTGERVQLAQLHRPRPRDIPAR
jgi:hypothetical protein